MTPLDGTSPLAQDENIPDDTAPDDTPQDGTSTAPTEVPPRLSRRAARRANKLADAETGPARRPRRTKDIPVDAQGRRIFRTDRERRDAVRKATREQKAGVRYRGGRGQQMMWRGVVLGMAGLSLIAFATANRRPTTAEVETQVQAILAQSGQGFPKGEAVMWASQVVRVWGTYDEGSAPAREVLIAPYLSGGMDSQAGWDGTGKQDVLFVAANTDPTVTDANHATVTAAYQIGDGTWRCVAVPVYAYRSAQSGANGPTAFALAANPAPVPCTPRTGAELPSTPNSGLEPDDAIASQLQTQFFPGFMAAWAASDQDSLRQYTDTGFQTLGLGGAMASIPPPVINIVTIEVDKAGAVSGKAYDAQVDVTWTLASGESKLRATYTVPVKMVGTRWVATGEPQVVTQAADAATGRPATLPGAGQGPGGTGLYPTPGVSSSTSAPSSPGEGSSSTSAPSSSDPTT